MHERTGRTAGNGSLMRTAPLALAYLDDEAALVEAARAVSELTHWDPEAGDACVLWSLAIRHAILTGQLDARIGLQHIPSEPRSPLLASVWVDVMQADSTVQHPGENGVADRAAPQHAGVSGVWIVGQLTDRTGDLHDGILVTEVGEGHRRETHQRAVARRAARLLVVSLRCSPRLCRRDTAAARRIPEHQTRLDSNVFGDA